MVNNLEIEIKISYQANEKDKLILTFINKYYDQLPIEMELDECIAFRDKLSKAIQKLKPEQISRCY
jgi:hypothetical protein